MTGKVCRNFGLWKIIEGDGRNRKITSVVTLGSISGLGCGVYGFGAVWSIKHPRVAVGYKRRHTDLKIVEQFHSTLRAEVQWPRGPGSTRHCQHLPPLCSQCCLHRGAGESCTDRDRPETSGSEETCKSFRWWTSLALLPSALRALENKGQKISWIKWITHVWFALLRILKLQFAIRV